MSDPRVDVLITIIEELNDKVKSLQGQVSNNRQSIETLVSIVQENFADELHDDYSEDSEGMDSEVG